MKSLILFLFCVTQLVSADMLPDFNKSVEFCKDDKLLSREDLQGKTVFVMFFQSWCGICNGWAPDAIKSFEKSYADKEGFIFVALKTDGGSAEQAKAFLEGKGVDSNRWLIGVDKNATLYTSVFGKAGLWEYLLVDPSGEIKKKSKLGMFSTTGNKKNWAVSRPDLLKGMKNIKGSIKIPANKELRKAAIFAELGLYAEALKMCNKSKTDASAKKELVEAINSCIMKKLTSSLESLKKADSSPWEKYEAVKIINEMKYMKVDGIRDALNLANKARMDKAVLAEERAYKEYERIMSKYKPDSSKSAKSTSRYLESLAKNYPGTHYGKIAAKGLQN